MQTLPKLQKIIQQIPLQKTKVVKSSSIQEQQISHLKSKKPPFKLDENGISDVITVSAGQNYSASYYIVKLNKKTEKGSDWKKYEKRLKEIIVDGRKQDTNFIRSIIAKAMTNANIKVKDDAFKSTFNQYLQNIGVETSDSSSSSKK